MGFRFCQSMSRVLALALIVLGGQVLIGCSKDSDISKSEAEQMKQGPPKEMPAQGKAMLDRASKSGPPPQAGPPTGGN